MTAVRFIDQLPDDFDPSVSHVIVRRAGLRKYVVSGLVSHPDIVGITKVPSVSLTKRPMAIESAVKWAQTFGICQIYVEDAVDAYGT